MKRYQVAEEDDCTDLNVEILKILETTKILSSNGRRKVDIGQGIRVIGQLNPLL